MNRNTKIDGQAPADHANDAKKKARDRRDDRNQGTMPYTFGPCNPAPTERGFDAHIEAAVERNHDGRRPGDVGAVDEGIRDGGFELGRDLGARRGWPVGARLAARDPLC